MINLLKFMYIFCIINAVIIFHEYMNFVSTVGFNFVHFVFTVRKIILYKQYYLIRCMFWGFRWKCTIFAFIYFLTGAAIEFTLLNRLCLKVLQVEVFIFENFIYQISDDRSIEGIMWDGQMHNTICCHFGVVHLFCHKNSTNHLI